MDKNGETPVDGPSATESQPRRLPGRFWVLWAGTVVNRLGLLAPAFLALYLTDQRLATGSAVALTLSVYGAGSVSAALIGGVLADRIGPRRTIMASQLLALATALALVVSRDLQLVVGLVFLIGVLSAIHRPASSALVVALVAPPQRTRAYGLLYWAHNIGASFAPLLAGLLLQAVPASLFALTAVGAAVYAALSLALPEIAPVRRDERRGVRGAVRDLLEPFSSRTVGGFVLLSFLLSCVYMQKQGALPLDMRHNGLSPGRIGLVLAFSGVLVVVLQPLSGPVARRLRHRSFVAAAGLVGVGFGLNILVASTPGYLLCVSVWTLGEILQVPMASAFIADHAPAGRTASYQGAYSFSWNLGLVVGAPIGQLVFQSAGPTILWSGAFLLCLAIAFAHLLRSPLYERGEESHRPAGDESPRRGPERV
ncbi:MFS transporter [Streptomyces sp. SID3343]|uniref:MFS transporter n=1 Tax=Streptomyces sp. SID3343 TaxID=2690260 RepID=UPI00136E88CA|nr:MFS transporter [Streptomyces sp. SID3343]MYW01132.1 MFS transporter [Streptomyces sp. SID3343]